MLISELLTRAQVLAGFNDIAGGSVDANFLSFAYTVFEQMLNDLNNDTRFQLKVSKIEYPLSNSPIASEYYLPTGSRRVVSVFRQTLQLRRVTYTQLHQLLTQNVYAIMDRKIEMSTPQAITVFAVPEIKHYELNDEFDIDPIFHSYIINAVAYQLAISNNMGTVSNCLALRNDSFERLMQQINDQAGSPILNPNVALTRLTGLYE